MPQKYVVAYCRVSTLEQKKKGLGVEIQIRDVTLFAEREGMFIQRFYKDEGISGTEEKRRGLGRLLRACRRGEIETVIIASLDRLSRDVRLAENLFWQFEQLGVQILMADMPHYNGQDRRDVLIRQIREAIAEENRKDIIERLWKGRQERTRRGGFPGGMVPYGYRRDGKRLVIDPHEAVIVRHILAEDGNSPESFAERARLLNAQGFRRRNGKPWTPRQIALIQTRRPLYTEGRFRYGEIDGIDTRLVIAEASHHCQKE